MFGNIWGIITGAGKVSDVVDTGLDVVKTSMKGLDALVYTSEEKAIAGAENMAKNMAAVVHLATISQNESGASAVTRRVVAFFVLGIFAEYATAALVFACLGNAVRVELIIKTAIALSVGTMALSIVVALFGYYSFTKGGK